MCRVGGGLLGGCVRRIPTGPVSLGYLMMISAVGIRVLSQPLRDIPFNVFVISFPLSREKCRV